MTDLIVALMTKEPDWALLPPATPRRIVGLLKRCLKKTRARGYTISPMHGWKLKTLWRGDQ